MLLLSRIYLCIYTHIHSLFQFSTIYYTHPLLKKKYILKALVFQQVCLTFLCRDGEKALGLTAEVAAAVITSDQRPETEKDRSRYHQICNSDMKIKGGVLVRRELPLLSPSSLPVSERRTELLLLFFSANLLNPLPHLCQSSISWGAAQHPSCRMPIGVNFSVLNCGK